MKRVACWIGRLLLIIIGLVATAWAFGAVFYDGPFGAGNKLLAALLAIAFLVILLLVRPWLRKVVVFVVLFAVVLIWWFSLSPVTRVTGRRM